MAVVLITGVLAALGTSMFRRHIYSSRAIEATSMIRSIAAAQERFRSETLAYLQVSADLESYYPATAAEIGPVKRSWGNADHDDHERWELLRPTVTGPVQYGYACIAGSPGDHAMPHELQVDPGWPADNHFEVPWYVIQAMGDVDGDGEPSYFVGTSFNSHIFQGGSPE